MRFSAIIVGAGLAGATLAERIATQLNKRVLLVEQRNHIAGNTYDYYNEEGILVQKYGPHIFHTKSKRVWDYLGAFTEWNDYVHRVLAHVKGKEVSLPINIETVESLYGRPFTPEDFERFLTERRVKLAEIKNSRDVVVSQVGEELYDLFFKNYTKKQWGIYPEELDAQVAGRLPVRMDRDTRYFTDAHQGIPAQGFTRMVEHMLNHQNIHVLLNTDFKEIITSLQYDTLIFTGPIDSFFDFRHGKLPYRSLDFIFETLDFEHFQKVGVVNYPNDHEYTRITEFKHFYFQRHHKTTICYEYPRAEGDPYYPIPKRECQDIYAKYRKDAERLKKVFFVGRLAEYQYLNMDQVVERSLNLFERIQERI
jgi:UDP-galactopyranose mutase